MLVQDLMTRPAVTVTPDTPVPVAAALLSGRGFTMLPVVDEASRLFGVVTEADLLRDRVAPDPRREAAPVGAEPTTSRPAARVGQVMREHVLATVPDADVAELVGRMADRAVRAVPVVVDGVVIGVISRRDVLEAITRSDAAIAHDVRRAVDAMGGSWVTVTSGMVTVHVRGPADHHALARTAAGIRGVVDVRVVPTA
jgi:CBS domain-containing protein